MKQYTIGHYNSSGKLVKTDALMPLADAINEIAKWDALGFHHGMMVIEREKPEWKEYMP